MPLELAFEKRMEATSLFFVRVFTPVGRALAPLAFWRKFKRFQKGGNPDRELEYTPSTVPVVKADERSSSGGSGSSPAPYVKGA